MVFLTLFPFFISHSFRVKTGSIKVNAWLKSVADNELFLSAVTLAEIQAGVELTRDQDPQRADELEAWLNLVADSYNILAMDAQAFRLWAKLMHKCSNTLYEDAMIAATARTNKLAVVTRNITDFKHFDVEVINPFEYTENLDR